MTKLARSVFFIRTSQYFMWYRQFRDTQWSKTRMSPIYPHFSENITYVTAIIRSLSYRLSICKRLHFPNQYLVSHAARPQNTTRFLCFLCKKLSIVNWNTSLTHKSCPYETGSCIFHTLNSIQTVFSMFLLKSSALNSYSPLIWKHPCHNFTENAKNLTPLFRNKQLKPQATQSLEP
jgi:hypothetical protein